MLLYPSEHYQPRLEDEDVGDARSKRTGAAGSIVNLLLALCGIALYADDQARGAFVVLIVVAAFNGGMALRR
jgi:hypothetical protein